MQHKSFNWTADRQHIKIGPHTFPRKKLTPFKSARSSTPPSQSRTERPAGKLDGLPRGADRCIPPLACLVAAIVICGCCVWLLCGDRVSGGTEFYPLDALILLLESANKKLTPTHYRAEADEQSIMVTVLTYAMHAGMVGLGHAVKASASTILMPLLAVCGSRSR